MTRSAAAMIRATLLGLLVAVAAVPAAVAQPAPAAAAPDPVRKALGLQLAQLLNSETSMLEQVERMLADALPKAMQADPNIAALEKQYPGVSAVMIDAMKPILLRWARHELPKLWDRLSALYAALSEADLRAAIAFYQSPLGQKMIAIMASQADAEPMLTAMAASGDYEVTEQGLTSTMMSGARQIVAQLSPEEMKQMMAFAATPAGKHVIALSPEINAVVLGWSNEPTPEMDVELEKAVREAIEKFTGEKMTP